MGAVGVFAALGPVGGSAVVCCSVVEAGAGAAAGAGAGAGAGALCWWFGAWLRDARGADGVDGAEGGLLCRDCARDPRIWGSAPTLKGTVVAEVVAGVGVCALGASLLVVTGAVLVVAGASLTV